MRRWVVACCVPLLVTGCTGSDPAPASGEDRLGSPTTSAASADDSQERGHGPAWRRGYDAALSAPVEDSVYPKLGDPGVDALHYDLDLAWEPESRVLTGREELAFRATAAAPEFQLDLSPDLEVTGLALDGQPVSWKQEGKDLVVDASVEEDQRYVLEIDYRGTPMPVPAPTTRADVRSLGWTVSPEGSTWTMQEPYGAYTWYAVNDQPADKALYDFTLRAPAPMTGVANGELESHRIGGGRTVTQWTLAEPAASYLTTVAFDEFASTRGKSARGVPVSIWIRREAAHRLPGLRRRTVAAVDWAEETLGPYPFDSLGFLFVDSTTGMETQTMITLGTFSYAMSQPVLVHEVVHHWWGDQVTPTDWRDVWMNEGMTSYLQFVWESEQEGAPDLDTTMYQYASGAQLLRDEAGPPADYEPQDFAAGNVYILPALMWHEIRGVLGDEEFFRLVREWPASHDDGNADTAEIAAWWEQESGAELADIFQSHLYDDQQPALG